MDARESNSGSEVQRACAELGIADWSASDQPQVSLAEARLILAALDSSIEGIEPEQFQAGLQVELEHGRRNEETNVTNNHPLLTGKIVLAHLAESLDYYRRLEIVELEGDIARALVAGDAAKTADLQLRLNRARAEMAAREPQ